MAKIVLLDGHSILHRTFYGIPPLNNTAGFPTNAIVGFLNILYKLMDEEEPEYVAVAFDVHAPTFRHELYKEYKGTRKPMPPELAQQIPKMKELLAAFGIVLLEKAGFEADDILGTIAKRAEAQGLEVSLISGDRDLLQIASKNIQIRIPKTKFGKTTMENYYEQDVLTAYHVTPEQFIELKALMGDPSDNIPGVPKIGEKTATTLMEEYGSIDAIYQNLDQITKKSIRESLEQNRALADLSKTLATIDTHAPIECDFHEFGTPDFWSPQAIQILDELEIRKRRNTKTNKARNEASSSESELGTKQESRRETGLESNQPKYHVEAIDADMFQKKVSNVIIETDPDKMTGILQKHAKESPIALQILTQNRQFYGFCLVTHEGQAYFCPITQETQALGQLCLPGFGGASYANEPQDVEVRNNAQEKILKIIETSFKKTTILTYNIKSQYAYLPKKCESHSFDLILGTYLLKPLQNEYTAEGIAKDYFDLDLRHYADLFGKKTLNDLLADPGTCQSYAEYVASTLLAAIYAYPILLNHLEGTGMMALMKDVEMPLTRILYEMEKEGIAVLRKELFAYGETLVARIKELEQQIYAQAGVTFTILSPKQLGEVLFERLSLPSGKKTKTGYSTAAEVLEKLVDVHPIIRDVLEYRGLTKLKSTYADGLATYIESDERIHTNFQQTITATGRISSTEPNLQNIPMRTELGRQIRKVFVPKEGCVFVDADYSQIELRVLAHMSGDKQLIEAYKSSADIHRITAAKVFHTPLSEVTPLQRRNAKAVNFGIVYGISSFGLSQDLSIGRKEAQSYIEQYFATYPGVKEFLDNQVKEAKETGFVTTLFGRRRPLPEIMNSNHQTKAFGERIAMNSPIQGTAADIMKIAMIKVWNALRDGGFESKLILQVHDELLVEAKLEEVEDVRRLVEENMKKAAELAVELEVDVHVGENWYEAK